MAQRTYRHYQEENRVGREREAVFHRSGDIRCCCFRRRRRFDCDVDVDDETVEGTVADEDEDEDEEEATAGDQRANELD